MSDRSISIGAAHVDVRFDYFPAERATRDEPGCPASLEITALQINGEWVSTAFCDRTWLRRVEHDLLNEIAADLRAARFFARIDILERVSHG